MMGRRSLRLSDVEHQIAALRAELRDIAGDAEDDEEEPGLDDRALATIGERMTDLEAQVAALRVGRTDAP